MPDGDNIERLECVYYPGPIPSNLEVLTTLCFVFDKIYFPAVELPIGGYDEKELEREISRLEGLRDNRRETIQLIGAMKFLNWRAPLDGILEYPSPNASFSGSNGEKMDKIVRSIYDANFPPRENFIPSFTTGHTKGLAGGEQSISYAGDFFYQAEAISLAAEKGIPLLDDGSGLPFPFKAKMKDRVQSLSAIMAIESVQAALPILPVLTPQQIVEFRMENGVELKNFRAAMLKLAGVLNGQLAEDSSEEEVQKKAKIIVETQVIPSLYELNRDLRNPNRAWHRRLIEGVGITASIIVGAYAAGVTGAVVGANAAEGLRKILASELDASGNKMGNIRRNGLYYLVRAQAIRK